MTKAIPTVSKYMTALPHSIEPHQSIADALKRMHELHVHHLPVRAGGKVVGILSERDIDLLASFKDVNLKTSTVTDAMTASPYCVSPDAHINVVASQMAEQRIGSALVVQENDRLVGIFTYTDALKTLAEVFDTRLK